MRKRAERPLVTLIIAVSLGLTALTIWAVARQGQALHERELGDVKREATTAAATHRTAAIADIQRACDAAARLWQVGGRDEIDTWAGVERNWLLVCVTNPAGDWGVFPRAPLSLPLPGPRDPNELGPPTQRYDPLATLDYFKKLTTDPDPFIRAGALLASADYEQRLGHPLAAARILGETATLLHTSPGLARFAFRAELRRIDALLAANDVERAKRALIALIEYAIDDHPARLGPEEVTNLEQRAATVGLLHDALYAEALQHLGHRAQRRVMAEQAVLAQLHTLPATTGNQDEITFTNTETEQGEMVIIAVRHLHDETRIALIVPLSDMLARLSPPTPEQTWQTSDPAADPDTVVLAELGPPFAGHILAPTPATVTRLRETQSRRWTILAIVSAGSAGAWILVIWLTLRAITRQRQLARLQSRFVADISHELKTPLALIRLLAETLAEGRVHDPRRIHDYHETITRESERLGALLDNILDMGRIESGRKVYDIAECNIAAVARQAWTLFEPQFAADEYDAHLEIEDDLPLVQGDGAALQQVIVNLLQNAYRYGTTGKYVALRLARDGHVVTITVEDHGIGMKRAELQRLGESFFRAEDTRVRQQRGTGLGLAIVNHIVTAHHGKIEVQSRPGEGTRFIVWIPARIPSE